MKLDDLVFYFSGLVGGALGIFSGLLMFFSPLKLVRFGFWVGRIFFGFKLREIEWRPGLHLDWRLVGIATAAISGLVLGETLHLLLRESYGRTATAGPLPFAGGGAGWSSLLGGLVFFLIGVYTLVRANALVRRMNQKAPFHNDRRPKPAHTGAILSAGWSCLGGRCFLHVARLVHEPQIKSQ